MVRILIGLSIQILSIVLIGSSYSYYAFSVSESTIMLSLGVVLWVVGYWLLHDYKQNKRFRRRKNNG